MNVGPRDPEGGHVLGDPSEVGAEAVGALSAGRSRGIGDASGSWVGFGQEGSQQQHGGAGGDEEWLGCPAARLTRPTMISSRARRVGGLKSKVGLTKAFAGTLLRRPEATVPGHRGKPRVAGKERLMRIMFGAVSLCGSRLGCHTSQLPTTILRLHMRCQPVGKAEAGHWAKTSAVR